MYIKDETAVGSSTKKVIGCSLQNLDDFLLLSNPFKANAFSSLLMLFSLAHIVFENHLKSLHNFFDTFRVFIVNKYITSFQKFKVLNANETFFSVFKHCAQLSLIAGLFKLVKFNPLSSAFLYNRRRRRNALYIFLILFCCSVDTPTEKRVRKWELSLEDLVLDPLGVKELMEYMKKEYSHENLRFWLAVQELRYGPGTEAKIKKKVKEIWE